MVRTSWAPAVEVGACELGRGLFALREFAAGETILKLTGRRYGRDDPIHQTPVGANLLQTGWRTYILLESPGVFANHSCNPNAGIRNGRTLVALRTIRPGAEICFDYSTTMAENFWTMACRCGDPACRGVVEDFLRLPEPLRRRYLEQGVVQRFIARSAGGASPRRRPGS
jgi:hypothetical protein